MVIGVFLWLSVVFNGYNWFYMVIGAFLFGHLCFLWLPFQVQVQNIISGTYQVFDGYQRFLWLLVVFNGYHWFFMVIGAFL